MLKKLVRPCSIALTGYVALLLVFWLAGRYFGVVQRTGGQFPAVFLGFALLLIPYWAFGFGAAERLRSRLRSRGLRILAPALLVLPYLVFSVPRHDCRLSYVAAFIALPVLMAATFELFPPRVEGLSMQDVVVLLALGLPVEFGWFSNAWAVRGLGAMPKLLLMDAALYAFLVVRPLPDTGYTLRPRLRDVLVGVREWAWFAPVGIGLGLALHFIVWRGNGTSPLLVAAGWLVTFFFVALPEELYFRGLLQNLMEKRFARSGIKHSRVWALLVASCVFGLSHFNKPGPFNWRYVLLAAIAGVFYGRAWRDRKRLVCSSITHATVDVVWSVWFR